MNANAELLNYVYQNSQMGVETLSQLLEMTDSREFKTVLTAQLQGYEKIHNEARTLLNESGFDEKGLNMFEKVRTYLMINLQTLADHSVSRIAKMLIQGSSMGITQAVEKLNRYEQETEKDVRRLMSELKDFEEKNVEKLKEFL